MNQTELSEYCRKKGLYPEQLEQWKAAFIAGRSQLAPTRKPAAPSRCDDKRRIQKLEKALHRKDKALAEAAALLVSVKKSSCDLAGARGRLIPLPDRRKAVALIDEAVSSGARKVRACSVLDLSVRTVQRWVEEGADVRGDGRKEASRPAPSNQLTDKEREQILDICNSERFKSMPPSQIVPALADEGVYVASESSFYRVLRAAGQQHHRGLSRKPTKRQPTSQLCESSKPAVVMGHHIHELGHPGKILLHVRGYGRL